MLTQLFSGWWGVMAMEGTGQAASRWADVGQASLHRLTPRTMLNVLLLCCGLLQGIQAVLDLRTADLSCGHLQKASGGLEGLDRARQASLQRKLKEASAEPAGESCSSLTPISCSLENPQPQNLTGDPLNAAQLLLALDSESSLAAHREWGLFFFFLFFFPFCGDT